MTIADHPADAMLTPKEARDLTGLTAGALIHLETTGRLDVTRTLSGHRRYRAHQIHDLAAQLRQADTTDPNAGMPPARLTTPHVPRARWSDQQRATDQIVALGTDSDPTARVELLAALGLAPAPRDRS